MVQFIQRSPSFGELLSQGIGQGLSKAVDFTSQLGLEKFKNIQRQKLLQDIEQGGVKQPVKQPQDMRQKFLDILPKLEQATGQELSPQDLDQIWSELNQSQKFSQEIQKNPVEEAQRKAKQYAALGEHELARQASEEAKIFEKRKKEEASRHYEISKDILKSTAAKAEQIPQKESALQTLEDAIKSNNLGFFSPDNLAELTGVEGLRSPEGAVFKTASKEFFIGNLSRVGAKGLNQWLERQISDMSQKIGRSTEANLVVTEALKTDLDVEKKQIEITNRIANEMEEKYGYVRRDLSSQVMKELSPYATEKQQELKSKIENIKEIYEPKNKQGILMYDPSGNLRRVPHKNRNEALKEGYRIP